MFLDTEKEKIMFPYPLIRDQNVLTDNFQQAINMAKGLEKKLKVRGEMEAYN